ncbi:MAG: helix-turn-helix domain-containing protein [Actinobacteria bacterium]|nr:helix-turn-helix domain-containing protein [Actinomycetota bacterium]
MTQPYVAPSTAAALLQLARLRSGLSQSRLAERAGVSPTMISAYERDLRQPSLPTLLKLLKAAGFDLRMKLVAAEAHDDILGELGASLSATERKRNDEKIQAWRAAEPVR